MEPALKPTEAVAWQWRPSDSKHWMTERFEETARYRVEQNGGGDVRGLYPAPATPSAPEPIEGLTHTDDTGKVWHPHRGYWCWETATALTAAEARATVLAGEVEAAERRIKDRDTTIQAILTRTEAAEAKVERLRAALTAVAEFDSGDDTTLGALHALGENRKIARAALATEDTTNA